MAKLQAKYDKWLKAMRNKDEKVRPYYITVYCPLSVDTKIFF